MGNKRLHIHGDHGDQAHVTAVPLRRKHHVSKSASKFAKKVLDVIDSPKPSALYIQATTAILKQNSYNAWTCQIIDSGDAAGANGQPFEFFSPRQIKDAEGVLFNNKVSTFRSWSSDTAEGPLHNLPAQTVTNVKSMSALFRFKNVSQHKTIVEMYVCSGKNGASSTSNRSTTPLPANPIVDWNQAVTAGEYFLSTGLTTSVGSNYMNALNLPLSFPQPFQEMWNVEKIVMEFEPGEEALHKLEGKSNYLFNGSKKLWQVASVGGAAWMDPSVQGCGKMVFFRILNSLTICTATAGDVDAITGRRVFMAHPPHYAVLNTVEGGIALEIIRKYHIEAPEGDAVQSLNGLIVNNNYHNPAGVIVDQEIESDQPQTIPANPT